MKVLATSIVKRLREKGDLEFNVHDDLAEGLPGNYDLGSIDHATN